MLKHSAIEQHLTINMSTNTDYVSIPIATPIEDNTDELEPSNTDETKSKRRIQLGLVGQLMLLMLFTTIVYCFNDGNSLYLRMGPNEDLSLLGIKINTWKKYIGLQFFIAFSQMVDVIIQEMVSPLLGFNIYNPDKKVIEEFTRLELQVYANTMWMITSLKGVVMTVISISQIDITLLGVVYGQFASFFTIRILLLEKHFPKDDGPEEE